MTHVWTQPDPIGAAIERHRAAYDAFQVAPDGSATAEAEDEYDAASGGLISTPCATRSSAISLLTHLRWWLAEEAEFSAGHQPAYRLAEARAADLTLFIGHERKPPAVIPTDLPRGRLPPPRRAVNLRRASRALAIAGEALAAALIVIGGIALTGAASLL